MRYFFIVFLLVFSHTGAQQQTDFGQLTQEERDFTVFERDTTANAVYLYELGNNYFEVRKNYIWLITEYRAKIKILKEQGFDQANIAIPYYHNDERSEKVQKIRAITHNGTVKTSVRADAIYTVDKNERWSEKRFTFPNVKVGSVLEYTYEVQSPFHFNLNGWDFQSDIPKVYTEYNAKIPGNWLYNRSLLGELPLDVNEAKLKRGCFSVPGTPSTADCEVLKYAMINVPAFYEDEEYMLSGRNYRSRLDFELSEYQRFRGGIEKYTKSWEDVDREFKKDQDIGRQLRKKNFFEKNVPPQLLETGAPLERAENIYRFVQEHFMWNGKYGIWHNNRVKSAFENKKGNVAEINITLINLLNAAGIETDMMLLATRKRGLPKKNHPVMSDFNYIVAKTTIEGQDYLLDATDKILPFGMLPYRCLNYYGRVMDFDDKSYWYDIKPEKKNKKVIRAQLDLSPENGTASGVILVVSTGHQFIEQQRLLRKMGREKYLETFEEGFGDDLYITSYDFNDKLPNGKTMTEQFEFEMKNMDQGGTIYLNPFILKFFTKNPFSRSERHYPIDFGYLRKYAYTIAIPVPEGYQVKSLPTTRNIALPGRAGMLRLDCKQDNGGQLNVFFDFRLNSVQYRSDSYEIIKKFFQEAVDAQTKSYIVLEKI